MDERREAARYVIDTMVEHDFVVTSVALRRPQPIGQDHPIYKAVVALEQTYPDKMLPPEGRRLWKRLLQLSREGDPAAFEAADAFIEWLEEIAGDVEVDLPDGPCHPYRFRWKGKEFDVPPVPWYLLDFIWGKKSVSILEIEETVWKCEDGGRALASALHKLNEILLRAGVPWQYGVRGSFVVVKE
jgi:hypothetical protein